MSINLPSVDPTVKDKSELRRSQQLEFLLTVLQSIDESNGNPDIIYPLLRQNLDLIDLDIIEVFRNWANAMFLQVDHKQEESGFGIINKLKNWVNAKPLKADRTQQKSIAMDIINLGNLVQQFHQGNKAVQMEWSIECYTLALKIFTVSRDCAIWADIQNNLAAVYSQRIKGDRAENLERSIECYRAALEAYTETDLLIAWADAQNNLEAAYIERIKGDSSEDRLRQRAENLERSMKCYRAALDVRTLAELPSDWAITLDNMATAYAAYSDRSKDDQPENLERSIECCRAALEVYTAESFPCVWANIQVNLARLSILALKNYEFAIEHLQSAYKQLSENNNDTGLLAETMFELARCFHKTGCLGQAKIYFKDSIRLYQRLEQPTQVAAVTSALGNLELQMGQIDDARIHLQTALEFYQAAGNLERVESIKELQQYLPVTIGAAGS
jgi:tetratricopeptide (TPR) repeat protein